MPSVQPEPTQLDPSAPATAPLAATSPAEPATISSAGDPPVKYMRQVQSFVQRSGRLKRRLQQHWDKYSGEYLVDIPRDFSRVSVEDSFILDPAAEFGRTASLVLEVGAGRGETIAAAAMAHPEVNHLACEVYEPGVAGILGRVGNLGLPNVRILHADAVAILTHSIAPASVDEVWVFFPDPWHKKRHNKRRLVNDEFAELVARVLRPGGRWRLATDWADYADDIAAVLQRSPHFTGGTSERFAVRPLTRFEAKAHDEGRSVTDFTATRLPDSPALGAPTSIHPPARDTTNL